MRLRSLVPVAACLAGCVSIDRQPAEQVRYLLDARRQATRPRPADGPVLVVRPFHASQGFSGKGFVYRRDGVAETDFYAEWFVPPAVALTELATQWLDRIGLFHAVVPVGTRLPNSYTLEADLLEISADYGAKPPHARLRMKWLVLEGSWPVVSSGEFDQHEPLTDTQPATYAQAQQKLAARFLEAMETALTAAAPASRPTSRE